MCGNAGFISPVFIDKTFAFGEVQSPAPPQTCARLSTRFAQNAGAAIISHWVLRGSSSRRERAVAVNIPVACREKASCFAPPMRAHPIAPIHSPPNFLVCGGFACQHQLRPVFHYCESRTRARNHSAICSCPDASYCRASRSISSSSSFANSRSSESKEGRCLARVGQQHS